MQITLLKVVFNSRLCALFWWNYHESETIRFSPYNYITIGLIFLENLLKRESGEGLGAN